MRNKKSNQPKLKLSLIEDLSSLSKRNELDGLAALISSINQSGKKAKAKAKAKVECSWQPEPEPPLAA